MSLPDFFRVYQRLHADIKAEHDRHVRKLGELDKYADSKQGRGEIEAEHADHEQRLKALRDDAAGKFNRALKVIEQREAAHAGGAYAEPPEGKLALVQSLKMVEHPTAESVRRVAEQVKEYELLLDAVTDYANDKGVPIYPPVVHAAQQGKDAMRKLGEAAQRLIRWDGRPASEIRKAAYERVNRHGAMTWTASDTASIAAVADERPEDYTNCYSWSQDVTGYDRAVIDCLM